MAPTLHPNWIKTMNDGLENPAWDEYDALIKTEIAEYNRRLARTPGFAAFGWLMFKALLWVESGGPAGKAWSTRPMQIGNAGDAGYAVLKKGREAAPLVMSDDLKEAIKGNISVPALNVRAGIAYALTRLARTDVRSVDDPDDDTVYEHTAAKGQNLGSIADKVGSTLDAIRKLNPGVLNLAIGQKLKYRKATMQQVFTGWRALTTANLAMRYNVGDATYAMKLKYVLDLFPKLQR